MAEEWKLASKQQCSTCRWYAPLAKQVAGKCLYPLPTPNARALGEMQKISDKLLERVRKDDGEVCAAWQGRSK